MLITRILMNIYILIILYFLTSYQKTIPNFLMIFLIILTLIKQKYQISFSIHLMIFSSKNLENLHMKNFPCFHQTFKIYADCKISNLAIEFCLYKQNQEKMYLKMGGVLKIIFYRALDPELSLI